MSVILYFYCKMTCWQIHWHTPCGKKNKQIKIQAQTKKNIVWGVGKKATMPNKNQERICSKCLCYGRLKGNRCEMIGSDLNKDKQTQPHRLIGMPSFVFFGFFFECGWVGEKFDKECWRRREPTPEKFPLRRWTKPSFRMQNGYQSSDWMNRANCWKSRRKSVNKKTHTVMRRRNSSHNGTSTKRVGNLWFFWAFPLSKHKPNAKKPST